MAAGLNGGSVRSLRSSATRTVVPIRRRSSIVASGRAMVTSSSVAMMVSGVRNSCEALPTKRRCPSNASASRSSMSSNAAASRVSSSSGPSRLMRASRLLDVSRRAVSVMRVSGRSTRPATIQPRTTDTSTVRPSTITDCLSSWCSASRRTCIGRLNVSPS